MSGKKMIILAGIIALVATVFAFVAMKSKIESYKTMAETEEIVVAKEIIKAKTQITETMLETKAIPKEFILDGAVHRKSDVIGSIAAGDIYIGQQLLRKSILSSDDTSRGLSFVIPKGLRAVSVGVNQVTGVAGLVKPGDKVDVIGTMDVEASAPNGNGEKPRVTVTTVLVQNVEVLAVGKELASSIDDDKKKEEKDTLAVTLAVPINKAMGLVQVDEKGKIRLLLRSPIDDGSYSGKPYLPNELLKPIAP